MDWTDEQQKILGASGNVLVSASAGSGKTTVMVQKIAKIICDGTDVNEVLVLTYTNASAADMRAKIVGKLYDLLTANDVDDINCERIRTQLDALSFSDIGTVDSFCARLIRENFEFLNISPTISLMDEKETADMKTRVMEKLISDEYEKSLPDFISTVEKMSKIVDDSPLSKVVLKVYDASRINPSPEKFKSMMLQSVTDNPSGIYGQKILSYYQAVATDLLPFVIKAKEECNTTNAPAYSATLTVCENRLNEIISCTQPENIVSKLLLMPMPSLQCKNIILDEYKKLIVSLREGVKKITDALCGSLSADYEGYNVDEVENYVKLIIRLVDKFGAEYDVAKKQSNKADFNDISQYAIKLLSDEKCAVSIANKYKFIFVDEYQDINPLQEEILSKLNRGNTFMVGDGKQGIFAFRNAEPQIMNEKSKSFDDGSADGTWLKMNTNFRSTQQILSFCDEVFSPLMTEDHGGVNYDKTSRFITDKLKEMPVSGFDVEFNLFTGNTEKNVMSCTGVYSVKGHNEGKNSNSILVYNEGVEVARRIKELIGKPYRVNKEKIEYFTYADIAILFKSRSEKANIFLRALTDNGIPYVSDGFIRDEGKAYIKQLISFLRVIDNSRDDIAVTGLLLSWFGKMKENDVFKIRAANPKLSVYDGVCAYGDDKCLAVVEFIKKWRKRAAYLTVNSLLEELIEDSGYEAYVLASPSGVMNLQAVRNFVRGIGSTGSNNSVQNFLAYYDASDKKSEPLTSSVFGNAVRIVTMHGSKGLEYPAVFIPCSDTLPRTEDKHDIIFDKDLGIGMMLYNDSKRSKKPSLAYTAISLANKKKESDERIRLLYVALTRAQRFLYISGCTNKNPKKNLNSPTSPILARTFSDLLLFAAAKNDAVRSTLSIKEISCVENSVKNLPKAVFNRAEKTYLEEIGRVVNFKYPYSGATVISPKYTVSDLNRSEDDIIFVPAVQGSDDNRKKGIAYHAVMENINFNISTLSEVNEFVLSLADRGILTEDEARLVDGRQILECINNPVVKEGIKGKYLREKPFMLRLDSSEISEEIAGDSVLVQGTADLILFGKETVVIDFKYSGLDDVKLAEKYKKQLNLYEKAVETAFGVKVDKKLLYSFKGGHFIEIK